MSRVEEMIERLCPDGVEYKALGGIAAYAKERIPATEVGKGCYVGVNELLQGYRGRSSEVHTPAEERCIAFHSGDVLLGNIRPYLKKMWLADCDGGTNGDVLVIRVSDTKEVAPEFLWQVLAGDVFTKYNIQHSKGAKMPRGDKGAILEARIPVPPMEIQQEIVRMLDSFAELEARRGQFYYYRNRLLADTAEGVTLVPLAKMGTFTGSTPKKSEQRFFGDEHPFYKPSDFDAGESVGTSEDGLTSEGVSASRVVPEGSTMVVCIGATIGKVGYVLETGSCNQQINVILPSEDFNSRYIFHLANSRIVQDQIARLGNFSSMPILSLKKFNQIEIPMPPRDVQDAVATALDRFDAIVHDMSDGLPAEIDARRKQYAYYRDKLLSFKEKTACAK